MLRIKDSVHVTPANVSEMREFPSAIIKVKAKGRRLYTDKGSSSIKNRCLAREQGFKNGIMEKAARNRPLNRWQVKFNREISKVRYKVEQCFGTLKRRFKFTRAAYRSTIKVEAQFIMKAIAFNLGQRQTTVFKYKSKGKIQGKKYYFCLFKGNFVYLYPFAILE